MLSTLVERIPFLEGTAGRIVVILLLAVVSHLLVLGVRRGVGFLSHAGGTQRTSKFLSIASLVRSFLVFVLYFGAFGLILREMGVSLTAYLASATVIGLAIGFGSQGLVQDVVTGLTLVLSNLLDVGDMVEIGGQTGRVRSIGMRFTVLQNAMGASVYIPNRSIANVINYPRGYIRCLVDIGLPQEEPARGRMVRLTIQALEAFQEQFPALLIRPAGNEGVRKTSSSREFLRLKFRIWPGRGGPIETVFKQELLQNLREIDPEYKDWMISVSYEVEEAGSGQERR